MTKIKTEIKTETKTLSREEWLASLPKSARIERNVDRSLEAWQWDARYGSTSRVGWWESPRRWHLLHPAWVELVDGLNDIHAA